MSEISPTMEKSKSKTTPVNNKLLSIAQTTFK